MIFIFLKKTATFQLILALSYSKQKTFVIYNYRNINWNPINKNVFIGYSDGKNIQLTNKYSNNGDSNNNPALITSAFGNTGEIKSKNEVFLSLF